MAEPILAEAPAEPLPLPALPEPAPIASPTPEEAAEPLAWSEAEEAWNAAEDAHGAAGDGQDAAEGAGALPQAPPDFQAEDDLSPDEADLSATGSSLPLAEPFDYSPTEEGPEFNSLSFIYLLTNIMY